jgi:L-ascorbate metabolism protein UlaG (beta-lactamase superfamily)
MKIRYIGHSCFYLESDEGPKILIDPFAPRPEAALPILRADAVLISHNHPDHSNLDLVSGAATVISGAGSHSVGSVGIKGFMMDHGTLDGRWLGMVNCFRLEMNGIRLMHLSDIGVLPTDGEIAEFGQIDVLFVPIGGHFTLDDKQAGELLARIKPRVAVPMHYAGPGTDREMFPLLTVDPFLSGRKNVIFRREPEVEINPGVFQERPEKEEIWVMTPWY